MKIECVIGKKYTNDGVIELISVIEDDFLQELRLVTALSSDGWSREFWFGIISKFPLCCILWFCDVWNVYDPSKKVHFDSDYKSWSQCIGYVQCPSCMVKRLTFRGKCFGGNKHE